jgi:hypothetical protein
MSAPPTLTTGTEDRSAEEGFNDDAGKKTM